MSSSVTPPTNKRNTIVKHHSSDKFEENTEYNNIYIILSFGSTFYRLFMKHVHKRSRRKNNFKKQKKQMSTVIHQILPSSPVRCSQKYLQQSLIPLLPARNPACKKSHKTKPILISLQVLLFFSVKQLQESRSQNWHEVPSLCLCLWPMATDFRFPKAGCSSS